MLSGVSQCSHLGPILFSLFMNDLSNTINFNNLIEHVYLQTDLTNFCLWYEYNMMELNIKKCKCMQFARNNFIAVNYMLGGHKTAICIACQINFGVWILTIMFTANTSNLCRNNFNSSVCVALIEIVFYFISTKQYLINR